MLLYLKRQVLALEIKIRQTGFELCFYIQLAPLHLGTLRFLDTADRTLEAHFIHVAAITGRAVQVDPGLTALGSSA